MKKLHLMILTAITLPAIAFAQSKDASSKVNAETEKVLTKMEQDFSAALIKGDAAALEGMLAENSHVVTPDGAATNKAEFIADVKSGALKFQQNQLSELKVHAADADMAVVTYRSTDKGTYRGQDISG